MINTCAHPDRPHLARGFCRTCYYGKIGPGHTAWLRYATSNKAKKKNYERATTKDARERRAKIRREWRYGITDEEYQSLLIKQQFGCAICHNSCKTGRRLSIDHAHSSTCTAKDRALNNNRCGCPLRGLLCQGCNAAIGRQTGQFARVRPLTPEQALYLGSTDLAPTKSHCLKGHPYAPENLYIKPGGGISCRQCWRGLHRYNPEYSKRYRETHREQIKRQKHEAYLRNKQKLSNFS